VGLALFDFDGTITTKDTFSDFMRFAASPTRSAICMVALAPLMLAYRAGWVAASTARPIAARLAFGHFITQKLRDHGERYAAEVLPSCIRPQALERIKWHQQRGDKVVVVSASLDVYLRPWCSGHGVELICTCLEERGGKFTGRFVDKDCSGIQKVLRIRSAYDIERFSDIYAYGDTSEDYEMLCLANHRYYRWRKMKARPPVGLSSHPGRKPEPKGNKT
jgi:phosphatidylglycerophosphatase C